MTLPLGQETAPHACRGPAATRSLSQIRGSERSDFWTAKSALSVSGVLQSM
jgi:hypothetical protein